MMNKDMARDYMNRSARCLKEAELALSRALLRSSLTSPLQPTFHHPLYPLLEFPLITENLVDKFACLSQLFLCGLFHHHDMTSGRWST